MKKYFIITDIDGNIVSEDHEFVNESDAIHFRIYKLDPKKRYFLEQVIELMPRVK